MSNVIGFKAFKNTLKRDSGYAPVSGENGYSVIRCVFPVGGDWDDISVVSAGFFVHPKDIASVTADITVDEEERAALFTIPGALLKQGERLHFGLFATVNGVTIATNTVALDVERGIVSDDIDYDPEEAAGMFEQFSNALNTALLGKANKAAAGSAGELAALDGNGSPIRSGVLVEQSIGEGSNSRVPTTAAVKTALDGKADKLVNGDNAFTDRILIASNNGGIKNSNYTINNARLSGDVNLTVPSSNVVANALAGKADKAADGTDGELAAFDGNGALKRSGVTVAQSVGGGSNNMVPTTAAVKLALDGKADKAAAGTVGELAAFDGVGALKRSGFNVAPSIGRGSITEVPTTAAVKLALDGKADKAPTGAVGELAAVDGNGALIRSGVSVTQSVDAGGNSKVPTTEAVKTALNGKADKLSSGGGGELVSATGNGEIQRSGLFVAQSIGSGAANMLPTTNAVRQHVLSMLDEALNGSDDGAPSLFVRQNTQTGKYQLVYEDSNDVLHVLFDFGLLPAATGEKGEKGDAGADGYSPTVSTTNLDAQTLVTVTDKNGAHNFYVKDGSSVTNAAVDENGDLIISIQQKPTSSAHPTIHTLEVNAGHVVGAAGAKGDKGDKGDTGNDYVLTEQDKADIADIVLQELPTTQGVLYGNTSD